MLKLLPSSFSVTFLSTLSLRRATLINGISLIVHIDFYPRSPCGERPALSQSCAKSTPISIHALLAESDYRAPPYNLMIQHISIHALLAESDALDISAMRGASISIHALLAESDIPAVTRVASTPNFYPRSPCGERPLYNCGNSCTQAISIHALLAESDSGHDTGGRIRQRFLSTLSLRRATLTDRRHWQVGQFLSTLSLRRATSRLDVKY